MLNLRKLANYVARKVRLWSKVLFIFGFFLVFSGLWQLDLITSPFIFVYGGGQHWSFLLPFGIPIDVQYAYSLFYLFVVVGYVSTIAALWFWEPKVARTCPQCGDSSQASPQI